MRRGFTMVSLVIYVALFFAFTVFATAISTNLNYKVLSEKGTVIINENYMNLYTNLLDSAKKSDSVDVIVNKIVFSNGDIYEYKADTKELLKNSGKLVQNLESFSVTNLADILTPPNTTDNINLMKCISLSVSFKKYNQTINKNIVFTVGDDLNV